MNARIDVILPYRNASETLDAALAGLLASGDTSLRVLAIDDASSDGSARRVRAWAARDRRVRMLRGAGTGLSAALNLGVAHASAGLVARMDADDLTHPLRLQRQRACLLACPELGVLGTRVCAFSDAGPVGEGLTRYVAWQNALLTPQEHRAARFI